MQFMLAFALLFLGSTAQEPMGLVLSRDPSKVELALLHKACNAETAKKSGLVLVNLEPDEVLIERKLWDAPELADLKALLECLEGNDGTSAIPVSRLPGRVAQAMLDKVNTRLGLVDRASRFDATTTFTLEWHMDLKIGSGENSHEASVVRLPSKTASAPIAARRTAGGVDAFGAPSTKAMLHLELAAPSTDSEYWRQLRRIFRKLDEHRTEIDKEVRKQQALLEKALFGDVGGLSFESLGPTFGSLPKSVQSQIESNLRGPLRGVDLANSRISDVRSSMMIVFTMGSNRFCFSPRALFDAP